MNSATGASRPRGKTVLSYGYTRVVGVPESGLSGVPWSAVRFAAEMAAESSVMIVPSGRVTSARFELMLTVTVSVVVAVSAPYVAVTVTTPATVPVGVKEPAPLMAPSESELRLQFAVTACSEPDVVSLAVKACDGVLTFVTARVGFEGLMLSIPGFKVASLPGDRTGASEPRRPVSRTRPSSWVPWPASCWKPWLEVWLPPHAASVRRSSHETRSCTGRAASFMLSV